jgi:hypothetical protein
MAKSATQSTTSPVVTFTPEALRAVIAQAIAEHEAAKGAQAKVDSSAEMETATVKAFKRAGYGEVKPRIETKTYNLWLQDGLRVKPGEKATKVRNLRLFHRSQVEPMTTAEKKTALAELEEKRAKRTADKLPPVSPVIAAPKMTPAPKEPRKSAKVLITEPGNA